MRKGPPCEVEACRRSGTFGQTGLPLSCRRAEARGGSGDAIAPRRPRPARWDRRGRGREALRYRRRSTDRSRGGAVTAHRDASHPAHRPTRHRCEDIHRLMEKGSDDQCDRPEAEPRPQDHAPLPRHRPRPPSRSRPAAGLRPRPTAQRRPGALHTTPQHPPHRNTGVRSAAPACSRRSVNAAVSAAARSPAHTSPPPCARAPPNRSGPTAPAPAPARPPHESPST